MSDEDWNRVLEVNLSGAFFMSARRRCRICSSGDRRIVNISSVIGQQGNIGQANYAASKSGLFGLTKTLAREARFQLAAPSKLAQDSPGVTVNAVAPGFIATEMVEHGPGEGARADHGADPGRPARSARGGRARRPFPRL